MYYSTCNVTLSLLVLLLTTLLFPWNLTHVKSIYYSLLQLMTACMQPTLSPINLWRRLTENVSCGCYPLLFDITAYAEVCLPSRCLEVGWITPFFHRCSSLMTQKTQPHLLLHVGLCLESFCLPVRISDPLQYVRLFTNCVWSCWPLLLPTLLLLAQ
jgi:hypothetical protein